MSSVRLRRSRLRFVLLAGLAALLAGGAGLAYAAADRPSVIFTGSGSPPLTCSSTPEVSGLTISQPAKVVLINQTGTRATVLLGGRRALSLNNGMAVRVTLKVGQHRIELRPDCLIEEASDALVVTVVNNGKGNQTPGPPPSPPVSPPASGPPHGTVAVTTGSPDGNGNGNGNGSGNGNPPSPGTGGSAATGTGRPSVGGATPPGSAAGSAGGAGVGGVGPDGEASGGAFGGEPSGSEGTGDGPQGSDGAEAPVIETEFGSFDPPYLAIPPLDNRSRHLLAVIALICVLGVTVGIIRAILAQRTDYGLSR